MRLQVEFGPDILVAREYAVAQYEIFQNDGRHISDPEESDMYYDRLRKEGYTLIKVKLADITNESLTNGKEEIIFKEDVTIPKGSYQFSHLFEDSEGCRHIMDERDNLRDQKEFIEEGINYKNNMEISIEAKLNHSEVTYPNSSEKLWNRPPYSVRVDVGGEDEFYIKSILIKNGNGKGVKFNVNDNNVLFDMEDMTVKYGLTNGKAEFIPHPKESEEVSTGPKL